MRTVLMGVLVTMLASALIGCVPKMKVVESSSTLLPGVVYVGAYVKHPTGMNVARIDQFQDGKCQHPGNTVNDSGIVNNMTKGMGAAALHAGGFVGGMAVRQPDQTNVSTSVSGTSGGSNSGAVARSIAGAGAAAGVANFNSNAQQQGQGQLQGQQQGQLQGQGQQQGQTEGNFSPICQ